MPNCPICKGPLVTTIGNVDLCPTCKNKRKGDKHMGSDTDPFLVALRDIRDELVRIAEHSDDISSSLYNLNKALREYNDMIKKFIKDAEVSILRR